MRIAGAQRATARFLTWRRVLCCVVVTIIRPGAARGDETLPLTEVTIVSSLDGAEQPCRIWIPPDAEPTPLLVSLHTWSSDYRQDRSRWVREAQQRGWIYLQPNFRGANVRPEACGSELARQDVLDAIDWTLQQAAVDATRIYLAGVSGGGHMAMLMAGYHPERFSAVSAWVGVSDLAAWYEFHVRDGQPQRYAQMIAACCGGPPGASPEVDAEYHARSPIHHLARVGDLPLDLNAGVNDGKTGSVPVLHTLNAFNVVAAANGFPVIPAAQMAELWDEGRLSEPAPSDVRPDPSYPRDVLLRRVAGNARVTIFEGGHEALPSAACHWLERQRRATTTGRVADERVH